MQAGLAADAFRKANGDLLRKLVQGGIDAGEFRPGDATLVEKMIAVRRFATAGWWGAHGPLAAAQRPGPAAR